MISRHRCGVALFTALVLGLASRRVDPIPEWVADHAGDMLWAVAVVLALALAWPGRHPVVHGGIGFAVAVAVELSQLWHADWLENLRENDLAALALGRGFLWVDLVRYLVGALLGTVVLALLRRPLASDSGVT